MVVGGIKEIRDYECCSQGELCKLDMISLGCIMRIPFTAFVLTGCPPGHDALQRALVVEELKMHPVLIGLHDATLHIAITDVECVSDFIPSHFRQVRSISICVVSGDKPTRWSASYA